MKILYLSSMYPMPANNGYKMASLAHIKELFFHDKLECKAYIVDMEDKYKNDTALNDSGINFVYISRNIPSFRYGFASKLRVMKEFVFSKYPMKLIFTRNKQALNLIKEDLANDNIDAIILDGIQSPGMLPSPLIEKIIDPKKVKNIKTPKIIYISHNNEFEFSIDIAKTQNLLSYTKIPFYLDALKIRDFENRLLKNSDCVICISASDYKTVKNNFPEQKVLCCPPMLKKMDRQWTYNNSKTLLFVGSHKFNPNYEAIKWLCTKLAPELQKYNPEMKILIAGTSKQDIPKKYHRKNVEFLGFITREYLEDLHCTCDMFICPIIYGSGIKMKVLDAISYGMPVFTTDHCLDSMDFMTIKPLIDMKNIDNTIKNIDFYLSNKDNLLALQKQIINDNEKFRVERRGKLVESVRDC